MKKVIIFAICILSFCATALIIFAISPNNDDNIYLNHTQIEMNLKDNAKLIVTQGKNDIDSSRIAWSSENKSIVEVDDRGVLIPKGYGNTTVYAKYSGSTLSCKVTVSEIFVASVEIGYDYSTISVGEEEQLSVSIRPSFADNKNIYWSSSNPFIASVDQSGHVVGLDEGSTSIVAKSSNNKISSFELTVLKEVVYTSFELNNQEVTLNISFSETLNYIAQPNNTVNKTISWQSSNSDIVEVNQEGRITAKKVGSATITATTSNGLQSQCVVEVPVAPIYKMEIINKTNNMISVKSGYQIECKVYPYYTSEEYSIIYSYDPYYLESIENGNIVYYSISVSSNGYVSAEIVSKPKETSFPPFVVTATIVDKNGKPIYYNNKKLSDSITLYLTI